jgi:hypothetical protein
MIRLSMGVVSDVVLMLDAIDRHSITNVGELYSTTVVSSISVQDAVEFAEKCKLLEESLSEEVKIAEPGRAVLNGFNGRTLDGSAFREMLALYVQNARPLWAYRTPSGRAEAKALMSSDEVFCFQEAALLDEGPSDMAIRWWDDVASVFRSTDDQHLLEIGRKGERLTVSYERARTGCTPVWKSVETNLAGYDVLSQVNSFDRRPLYIEVKTSERDFAYAEMIISLNEWRIASMHGDYCFYLWLIDGDARLAEVSPHDLASHIPKDRGMGSWETVRVPFSACVSENQFLTYKS